MKQKKTKTPTPTATVNSFYEISLIEITHRHKILIKKGASELVVAYYPAKSQNNDTTSAQFKATQAKLSAACLTPKMVGDIVHEMKEDLSGKLQNFIKNGYVKFDIKLDIETGCKFLKLANNESEQRTITVFMFSLPLVNPKPTDSDDEISVANLTPSKMGKSMVKVIKKEEIIDNLEIVSKSGDC